MKLSKNQIVVNAVEPGSDMDWLEGPNESSQQPAKQEQTNPMDINDAFTMIAIESFEPTPKLNPEQTPPSTTEKQKGHKFLSKKKQGKRK
jgi:hypothetical protein